MRQLRKFKDLQGYSLQARDGEIGKVLEMYFDDEHWTVRYLVVRTGSWLLGRDVLIAPRVITGLDEKERHLQVDLTREQVKNSPTSDTEKTVSRYFEAKYHLYYGWEPYWIGIQPTDPMLPGVLQSPGDEQENEEHPHLRSSKEVRSYDIHARDGVIGEVKDFIVDSASWALAYIEIDTGKWLPGKKVLIAPKWVWRIDWSGHEISVNLLREIIESAPPYEADQPFESGDEERLLAHYGHTPAEHGEASPSAEKLKS
jgi:hypothetical protein